MGAASTFRSLLALSLLCYGTVEAAPHKPMHLAFVLLSEATMPKAETIASAFVRFAAKGDQLVVTGTKSDGKIAVLTFDVGTHGTAFVAMTPMPVPKGEADAFARYSLASLGSKWKLPPHKAHLVVSLTGHDG